MAYKYLLQKQIYSAKAQPKARKFVTKATSWTQTNAAAKHSTARSVTLFQLETAQKDPPPKEAQISADVLIKSVCLALSKSICFALSKFICLALSKYACLALSKSICRALSMYKCRALSKSACLALSMLTCPSIKLACSQ